MDWNKVLNDILTVAVNWIATAGIRLFIALVLLFVTFKIVNAVARKIERSSENGRPSQKTQERVTVMPSGTDLTL